MRFAASSLTTVSCVAFAVVISEPMLLACGSCMPNQQSPATYTAFRFHSSVGSHQQDFVEAANDWNGEFQSVNSGVQFVRSDSNGWVEISFDISVCPDWGVASRQHNYIKICPDALLENVAFGEGF